MDLIPSIKTVIRKHARLIPHIIELNRQLSSGLIPIYLDYGIDPQPRYGWGKPQHEMLYGIFDKGRARYARFIEGIGSFKEGLRNIPFDKPYDELSPYWSNGYAMGIDAVSLYVFSAMLKPRLYVEIGSGNSTKFVRKSIKDNRLDTKIISVDPYPRAEVDSLCDRCVRDRLENADLRIFDQLHSGDILMIDNSHRCFQNSDVTTVFLDILPRLNSGVVIYFDDIYLPHDYPPDWVSRYYSEQYLLAVLLMADAQRRYEILLPSWFCSADKELRKLMQQSWKDVGLEDRIQLDGNGLWLRVTSGKHDAEAEHGK